MTPQQLEQSAQGHAAEVFPDMMNDIGADKPWPEVRQYLADAYVQGAIDERAAQWISVHDRVPKSMAESVLTYSADDLDEYAVAYFENNKWYTIAGMEIQPDYWMTIPQAPADKL